jgi:GNAT superfamily N-acetyltransferase
MDQPIAIAAVSQPAELEAARALFREYAAGLGIDLAFQGFEEELAGLPGKYAAPGGIILLAWAGPEPVGCIALRPMAEPGCCEVKRLFVRSAARGARLGDRLAAECLAFARSAGYRRAYLDTLLSMTPARRLYASHGFQPVSAYYDNPLPDVEYMALDL